MKFKKLKKWILLLIWMSIIFLFSSQAHSGQATKSIIEQLLPNIKTNSLIEIINFLIRKLAHLAEYFILAILTISLLKEYTKQERIILLSSFIFCFIYACTDEYHQSFVPGRSSLFRDVLIDTTGSLIAIILNFIYIQKYSMNQKSS